MHGNVAICLKAHFPGYKYKNFSAIVRIRKRKLDIGSVKRNVCITGAAQPGAKEPVDERKCPAESTPKKQALKNSSEDEEENDEDDEEDDEDDEEDDEDNHSDSDSMLSQVSTPVSKKSKKKGRSAKIDECGFDDLQISSQLSGNGSQHKVISVYKDPMMSQHVLPNWVLQDGSVDGIFDPSFKNASRKTTSCPRH